MDRNDKTVAQGEVDKVLKNPALASLDAVKNKRVNSIALGEMYSSGISLIYLRRHLFTWVFLLYC